MTKEIKTQYLAIRNWDKYQAIEDGRSAEYIKDYVNKDLDLDHSQLTMFQRGLLDALRRLRGRIGHNLYNDHTWIARAVHAVPTDMPHIKHGIHTLTSRQFLLPSNERFNGSSLEEYSIEEKSITKEKNRTNKAGQIEEDVDV